MGQVLVAICNESEVMAKTLTDAYLVLLLAATIHGTNAAVRDTAKRCAKTLPRSKRDVMYQIVDSKEPLRLVFHIAENLD
ncbi:hypothetical protein GIW54_15715 [Pseudomonas proteolytica]|jgi:hypothetical protein|uniref:DUF7740 domain-containing protein n=2 Tax=Pseudomonas TaxID=286 RepID=A0AAW5A4S8_9PSED|nr:hypothetical protein FQ182_15740 [Pseudomonas sp. ANT_H4]KAA0951576.1 hypothetical protein FQ186_15475 [Pseudomonas sp. ANT_H14]KAA8704846.1 hypothetical protein F4W61_05740 [Pseudomonas proteolytica]POA77389.1 hypothetical protein C1890_16255 [Pseudomonas sp. DP16D-R1]MCF5057210.1 hypothetical protein [Pseudomonas proteolytica]